MDISSEEVLHSCLQCLQVLGLTVRNGRNMTTDPPRAGVDEDAVTGLPWKSVFRGARRKCRLGRDHLAIRRIQETPHVLAQTSPLFPFLVKAICKLESFLFIQNSSFQLQFFGGIKQWSIH